jgi:hypothetical protein
MDDDNNQEELPLENMNSDTDSLSKASNLIYTGTEPSETIIKEEVNDTTQQRKRISPPQKGRAYFLYNQ